MRFKTWGLAVGRGAGAPTNKRVSAQYFSKVNACALVCVA